MSGVIAFGCGCQTGILLGKRSHKLLLICRALALGQTRTMASRRNRRITHRPTSYTDDSTNHDAWDSIMSHLPNDKVATREQMLTSKEKDLFHPVIVAPKKTDGIDIGAELTGVEIEKHEMLKLLRDFYSQPKTQLLAAEHGLDMTIYKKSFDSFRHYCVETEQLPVDFHIVLSDIISGAGHVDDIFPYFLQHAHQVFPHLECIDELRNISDLTEPSNWYPTARKLERKIIYHVGPTNSGKTYHALQRFYTAKSGVYCGPLRMLAVEVFNKCNNEAETPCDLVTGEDRRQANPDKPAEHVACTVEMASLTNHYEVAIIDEIQMLRDSSRGWAWTKALLGLNADEIHVCGEGSAVDIVQEMVDMCGDEMEVRKYDRLTKLTILDKAVGTLKNIRAGDCIVCFGKNDIYSVTTQLESLGYQTAVIYGGLPPGTKYAQAEKFNDPNDSCSILVATDAIGMGLNLSIKRIIFFSLIKPTTDKDGSKQMEKITTSQALQIAGRAGRFGTQYEDGEVTTFRKEDLPMLKVILGGTVDPIEQVGLHPTAEQIELFAYHLPKATLSNLIDIFIHLCRLDYDKYFMCNMEDFKFLANIIEHIPLALRVRYTLCSAPISSQDTFTCNMFIKFARQYSTGLPITYDWLMEKMKAPFQPPKTLQDLVHLEQAFDVFDLYLWLGYRFTAMFPDMELVRESQTELDYVIQESVAAITALLKGPKTVKTKAPVIIATEKSYGRRLQLQPHKEKLKTKVHGAVTINEGSKATIQMENVVDSQLSDADSQISDRTASPVADLFSDSNPLYDDQETGHKGVETISHNETDIMKEIIDIRETKYKIDLPVVNRECEDIQKKKNIFSADKNKGEENVIDLIDDTIKDMDVVRESEDKENAFSTVKGIRQQNETDLVGNRFRNMGVKESEKYIKRAFGRVYAINRGEGEDADINQPENTGIRDHLNSHFKKVKQHPFDFHFSKNIKQGNKSAFIKTEDIDTKNIRGRETLLYNKFAVRMPKRPRKNLMNLKNLFQSSESVTEKPAETGESLTVESQPGPMEEESLMSTLIKKGLITEEMMAQLHREWREAQERTHSNSDSDSDGDSVSIRKAEQRTLRNSDSDSDSVGNRKAKQRTSRNSDSDSDGVGNRKAKQRTYNNNDNVSDRDSVT